MNIKKLAASRMSADARRRRVMKAATGLPPRSGCRRDAAAEQRLAGGGVAHVDTTTRTVTD
jgi:hypothetical protein